MPSPRHQNPVYRFLHRIGESPVLLLDWLQYFLLAWLLVKTLVGFGGFMAYGSPMVGVSGLFLGLAAVHALVVLFKRDRNGMSWELLLPLPFIAYAYFHYRFLSPAPWEASLYLTLFVQAYVLYFIAFNSAHGTRSTLWLLTICQLVVVTALLAAFFQFYQFPEWMVTLERERNPAYLDGAAGFLMDPLNLGSLLILFWPLSVMMVWVRRFPGPIRILNGFLVLAILVGFLLSTHRLGIAILGLLVVVLPFFLEGKFHHRWRLWIYAMVALLVLLPFFWFATDALHERIAYYLAYPADELGAASIQSAWNLFSRQPLIGEGLGSYHYFWESVRPASVEGSSLYPLSGLAGILGETGLTGLFLLAGPVAFLLFRGLKRWSELPHLTVSKDVRNRIERYPKGHPSGLKMERANGRMPSTKIVLGGLFLGILAFSFYTLRDYSLNLPLHLFVLAILLAELAYSSRTERRQRASRRMGMAVGLVPLLLAVWAFSFGAPRFYSQHLEYTASETLESLLRDRDRIFMDPGSLSHVRSSFDLSARLNPENADAWTGIGRSHLALIHADLWPSGELAAEALPALEEALERAPNSWLAHHEIARALAILDGEEALAEEHLFRAMHLAPHRVEPVAFLGSLLLLREGRTEEGRELIEKALALNPDYEPLQYTARRMDLGLDGDASGRAPRSDSVFNQRLLAEQFDVLGNLEARVLGAGIMPPMESLVPEPE